jgi:hypothetical protein
VDAAETPRASEWWISESKILRVMMEVDHDGPTNRMLDINLQFLE